MSRWIKSKKDLLQPPNEIKTIVDNDGVRNGNEIRAGIGNKDKAKLMFIDIRIAYILSKYKYGTGEDIGLIFTQDEKGKGKNFYDFSLSGGPITSLGSVGSICLARENPMTAQKHYSGKIVTVGWGLRYSFKPSLGILNYGKPKEFNHTCTTNEFGPTKARFQHCNVDSITKKGIGKWGCNTKSRPPGYDVKKCAKYLKLAEKAIDDEMRKHGGSEVIKQLWSLTSKIEVSRSSTPKWTHTNYICYKEKTFTDYGWCDVGNRLGFPSWYYGYVGKSWGFCSSSCKLMNIGHTTDVSNLLPQIYHKAIWQYPAKPFPRIKKRVPRTNYPSYYLRFVSYLPQASVFRFKKTRGPGGKLKYLASRKEESEEELIEN